MPAKRTRRTRKPREGTPVEVVAAPERKPEEPREPRETREPREPRQTRRKRGGRRVRDSQDAPQPPRRESTEAPAPPPAPSPAPAARRGRRSGSRGDGFRTVDDWFSPERLDACQRAIGYHFRDLSLLIMALTHSSIKSSERASYERLEFLGDSVIGMIVTEYLYNLLPDCDEGELTKLKSAVVSTHGLADAARGLGLDNFLGVGRGIQMKDELPKGLIADVFEAVAGAVYLDRGYEAVRLYSLDLLRKFIEVALSDRGARNFKSVLQQVAQRDFNETPRYEVVREVGPDHAREFEVRAVLGSRRFDAARAANKKDAEQAAAKLALQGILVQKSRSGSGGGGGGGSSRRRGGRSRRRA